MITVFGVDDLKVEKNKIIDPRLKEEWPDNWYEELGEIEMIDPPYFIKYAPGNPQEYYQVIQWDWEFGLPSVIGLITSELPYDSQVIRALSILDEKYLEAGYQILPTEAENSIARRSRARLEILPQHFYKQGFCDDVEGWIEAANYIFNHLKLDIKPEEMKWMLYWQWS